MPPVCPPAFYNHGSGDGPGVGVVLASHPDIDMVSFTGSTGAGIEVAVNAAPTVKRSRQELGGKSPNIVLDDEDFAKSVVAGSSVMMVNSWQSCNAVAHARSHLGWMRPSRSRVRSPGW